MALVPEVSAGAVLMGRAIGAGTVWGTLAVKVAAAMVMAVVVMVRVWRYLAAAMLEERVTMGARAAAMQAKGAKAMALQAVAAAVVGAGKALATVVIGLLPRDAHPVKGLAANFVSAPRIHPALHAGAWVL